MGERDLAGERALTGERDVPCERDVAFERHLEVVFEWVGDRAFVGDRDLSVFSQWFSRWSLGRLSPDAEFPELYGESY